MGRVTTIATDGTGRELVSYVAPGDDDRIIETAMRWVAAAERDGRSETCRIQYADGRTADVDAGAVKAAFREVRRRQQEEHDKARAAA